MADKKVVFTVNYKNLSVYDEFNVDKIQYPLILSIPHSGTVFPPEFLQNVRFDEKTLRRNEDLLVDELLQGAIAKGLTALKMNLSRAFVDLNRDRLELDPTMFYNYPKEKDILLQMKELNESDGQFVDFLNATIRTLEVADHVILND